MRQPVGRKSGRILGAHVQQNACAVPAGSPEPNSEADPPWLVIDVYQADFAK
jgi:hypothetical protein